LAVADTPPPSNTPRGIRAFFGSRREEIIEKQYEELKELESKYRALYENAPVLLRTINRDGVILDCNNTYVERLGYSSKSEVIGHTIFDHTPEEYMTEKRKGFEEWRKNGNINSHETWLKRKDGSSFPALLSANDLHDARGNFIGSNTVITDLTEICEARRLKEKATEELKTALEMKEQFLNIAAHELRTPIQPILGYTELLEKGIINAEKMVEGIRESAIRLRELANDLLDVAAIQSGQFRYNLQHVKASSILNNLVIHAEMTIESYGKTKDVIVVSGAPASDGMQSSLQTDTELKIDEKRLMQALQNIVNNAIKFTDKGQIGITSSLIPNKGLYQIDITDTGCGIPPEIFPKLFEKFASKTDEHTRGKGTGLGLFIANEIVQAHGGHIVGSNRVDGTQGAIFQVRLPVAS
jgi:PAS domain S-box-containing protein